MFLIQNGLTKTKSLNCSLLKRLEKEDKTNVILKFYIFNSEIDINYISILGLFLYLRPC